MDTKVQNALRAGISAYAKAAKVDTGGLETELVAIFGREVPFLEKVEAMDAVFDGHPAFEELREIYFDLLMVNFFAEDAQKLEEDYMESPEWEAIEEETIDRGTELLNVFLYLRECADEDIEPSLDDFLNEFLLVDEDEFQDEHQIYESMIANRILEESDYAEIAKVAGKLPDENELKDLFYGLMGFFYEPEPSESQWAAFAQSALNPPLDSAIYRIVTNFHNQNHKDN